MKLLLVAALLATCGMVGLWAWTSAEVEAPRAAAASTVMDQARESASFRAANLSAEPAALQVNQTEAGVRIEIIEPDFDFPEAHWLGAPEHEPELEHPDGSWLLRHENGEIDEQGAYANDLEVGEWRWWYDNGERKAIGQFDRGMRVGTWTWWHDNGNVLMEGQYENDEGVGPWKMYHENGTLWGEGQYIDGEIGGRWSFWFDDGAVDEHRTGYYEAGVLQK